MRVAAAKKGRAQSGGVTSSVTQEACPTDRSAIPPYLGTQELMELTPWSSDAIEKMIARGILVRNVHFFQPGDRRDHRSREDSRANQEHSCGIVEPGPASA